MNTSKFKRTLFIKDFWASIRQASLNGEIELSKLNDNERDDDTVRVGICITYSGKKAGYQSHIDRKASDLSCKSND